MKSKSRTNSDLISTSSPISDLPLVGPAQTEKLTRLNISTVRDLLYHFPIRYQDTSTFITLAQAKTEGEGTVIAKLISIKTSYTRFRKVITRAVISDESSKAGVVWFNQGYLAKSFSSGESYIFELKMPKSGKSRDFYCTAYEKLDTDEQTHLGRITPFYDQTAGISSKWLRARLKWLKPHIAHIVTDHLTHKTLLNENLISLTDALIQIHFPESLEQLQQARKRLGFDEMLTLASKLEAKKAAFASHRATVIKPDYRKINEFLRSLSFELTDDQNRSVQEILSDLTHESPMQRVLNGDVGSGKTVVAAIAAYAVALQGESTLIMAPTTILAQQHYRSFSQLFEGHNISIQLLISGEMLEPTNKPQIIIGTQAILFEKYLPSKIGLVIADEQHRFGVGQREKLKKGSQGEYIESANNDEILSNDSYLSSESQMPHYLAMTATPIPRTLTSVIYGDMDISIIKQLPKNRIPIRSYVVPASKSQECYKWIADKIKKSAGKEQAYIIFPLIEQSEKSDLKSAKQMYEQLKNGAFKELNIELLHGRFKDSEKDSILKKFKEKKADVLISTTVVEVGIDIPDATIIVIENAERFGLAQLHQLRGRVGRGTKESFCYVIPSSDIAPASSGFQRLRYFAEHSSGFEIAEYDLNSRGPGEVYGNRQSGIPNFKIASIADLELLRKARAVARSMQHYSAPLSENKRSREKAPR